MKDMRETSTNRAAAWAVALVAVVVFAVSILFWFLNPSVGPKLLGCEGVPDPGKVEVTPWSGSSETLATVSWPTSGKWGESVVHLRVNYSVADGDSATMDVLCGVESDLGMPIDFSIEPRTGYDGPTLRLEQGFAFITFQWPLIWMKNIDAGPVGTTAIMRKTGDELQVFLIRNAKQLGTGKLTTDCDSKLDMNPAGSAPQETIEFKASSPWDIVMIRHAMKTGGDFEPIGSSASSGFERTRWLFDVSQNAASGALTVTPKDSGEDDAAAFLEMVLEIARCQELYILPGNCP